MSAVSKGNQLEIEVKNYWTQQGWSVFRQHRKPMFIKGRMITVGADIFGCDLVCKKQGERTCWIQIATDGALSTKVKQVLAFPWNLKFEDVEIWLRIHGKKAYRRYTLRNDGTFNEVDSVAV